MAAPRRERAPPNRLALPRRRRTARLQIRWTHRASVRVLGDHAILEVRDAPEYENGAAANYFVPLPSDEYKVTRVLREIRESAQQLPTTGDGIALVHVPPDVDPEMVHQRFLETIAQHSHDWR